MSKVQLVSSDVSAIAAPADKTTKTVIANIDSSMHKALKIHAITNDMTMEAVFTKALAAFITKNIK